MPKRHKKKMKNRRRAVRRSMPRSEPPMTGQGLLQRLQATVTVKEEKKETKDGWVKLGDPKEGKTVKLLPMGTLRGLFKRYETRICLGGQYKTNTGVSYVAMWDIAGGSSSNSTLAWNQVGNASEFTTLDAIFDEFFVRSSRLRLFPSNKYSAQGPASFATATAAGSPGTLNTCAATLIWLPHAGVTFSSSAGAWVNARSAETSIAFETGDCAILSAKNTEKFAWDGPLGDPVSASTQSWCMNSNSAKYGGTHQLVLAHSSGASVSAGLFPEGAQMGDWLLEFIVAWRARA
jgi:hypothetical protein